MRAADRRSRSRARTWLNLLTAIALFLGMMTPFVAGPAVAQRVNDPAPPLPVPYRVAALGYFQTALGCPADYDPTCPLSDLRNNGDGTWSAFLPIPAGDWSMLLLHQSDRDRNLGVNGIPDGPEVAFSVPTESPFTYVAYDAYTGAITVQPAATSVEIVTELGQQIAMRPKKKGGFRATFDGQPGQYGFQVLVNGQPVAQDSVSLDDAYRVIVEVDDSGQVVAKDIVQDGRLTIERTDATGVPQPDACFGVFDPEQDGALIGQACDNDDQNPDGKTTIRFLDGLKRGQYELRETLTPDGQQAPETQRIDLGPGRQSAQMVVGGGEGEQDQTAAGQLTISVVNGRGKPLGFACFIVYETGQEACDDDGDGTVNFDGMAPGFYTVAETVAPEGRQSVPEQQIEVTAEGGIATFTHAGDSAGVPDAGTDQGAVPGSVVVRALDASGAPVVDACFTLTEVDSGEASSACDGDDGVDGATTFPMLRAGAYDLAETETPAGVTPPESMMVDVLPGEQTIADVVHQAAAAGVGGLVIDVTDDSGQPVGGSCFDLFGPIELRNICDDGDDGVLSFTDLPIGEYTVTQIRAAEGRDPADPVSIMVQEGEPSRVAIANPLAGETSGTGTIELIAQAPDGTLAGGACFSVSGPAAGSLCDDASNDGDPTPGMIRLDGMPIGDYLISVGRAPIGYAGGESQSITVQPDATAQAVFTFEPAVGGSIAVTITRQPGLEGPVCVDSLNSAVPGTPVCDNDSNDRDPASDIILITDVPPGDYGVMLSTTPQGSAYLDAQPVTVRAGEFSALAFNLTGEGTSSIKIMAETGDGEPATGGCYLAADPATGTTVGPVCDDDADGTVVLPNIAPGTWAVSESTAPSGMTAAEETQIATLVNPGEEATVTFRNSVAAGIGDLVITVSDEQGVMLPNSCVMLTEEATGSISEEFCDRGDDGILAFPEMPSGTWVVTLTRVAQGFDVGEPAKAVIQPGQETTLQIVLRPASDEATPSPAEPAIPGATATSIPEPSEPGSLRIVSVNEQGGPIGIGGECYDVNGVEAQARVCDGSADDVDGTPGVLQLDGLPAGPYTIAQTRAPEGYQLAGATQAEVASLSLTELAVVNVAIPAATGSLSIETVDEAGNLVGGACYGVVDAVGETVSRICDGDRDDRANPRGVVEIANLPAGPATVEQVVVPDGFAGGGSMAVDIVGDSSASISMAVTALAPAEGEATFQAFDEDGQAVLGQCFSVTQGEAQFGPFCDGDATDLSGSDGEVTVAGLPVGEYQVVAQPALTGDATVDEELAQQARADARAFTVRRGDAATRVKVNVRRQALRNGNLLVNVRNDRNEPLAGACLSLTDDQGGTVDLCDNDRNDGDSRTGQILFTDVRSGDSVLRQTQAPAGYESAPEQSVKIRGGATRQASIQDQPTRTRTGGIVVVTQDANGTPVAGACYTAISGTSSVGPVCDTDDGADGYTAITDLSAGAYVIRMTTTPPGYSPAGDTAVRVVAGETAQTTMTLSTRTGSMSISTVSDAAVPLAGACYALVNTSGAATYSVCDNDSSDQNRNPGIIRLSGIVPGMYAVRQTQPPGGYLIAAETSTTVNPGQRADVVVINQPLPAPASRGDLLVSKTDSTGALLSGACWAVIDGDMIIAGPICDDADGMLDGLSRFNGIAAGDYLLRETRRPSANYGFAADQPVAIVANRVNRIAVVNYLVNGRVLVQKTDPNGQPLAGACFDLQGDSGGEVCTDVSGNALFVDVAPGSYLLRETVTPVGYVSAAPVQNVRVNPAATTVITVTNRPLPPPVNSGSLQVIKFICPAGEQGPFTAIFDSSDPSGAKLGLTAGCVRGDAGFLLESYAGLFAPTAFRTGSLGQYQITLPAGGYLLTETDPVLGGETAEEFSISANQLTTVIVLNFVAPPQPAPSSVVVTKYTCDPGLQGVVFADFMNACGDSRLLTNNVTFRLAGMVSGRQVTGDGGEQGVTRFAGLPAGSYRLKEEPGVSALQSVTIFCGVDPANPTMVFYGFDARFDLAIGQSLTCTVFNVPVPVNPTTGTIVVHKYACAITTPPPGYDWFSWCAGQGAGVRFAVSSFDGEKFVPKATGATDQSSTLRFTDAPPGTYQLKEIDATWCHAQSDSVDANGNIVVKAGQVANIWIFNCIGATNPPNTGAGPGSSWTFEPQGTSSEVASSVVIATAVGVASLAPLEVISGTLRAPKPGVSRLPMNPTGLQRHVLRLRTVA